MWYEQKSGTRGDSWVCHRCDLLVNRRTATWIYLFRIIKKLLQLFLFQNLSSLLECRPLSTLANNAGKINAVFVFRAALWAKNLGCCLEHCRCWQNTLGKRAFAVNIEGHSIRILNERSRFSNQYRRHLILAMHLAVSCSELYFARCCALRRTDIFQIN